ncbi:MAG: cobalamin biosynthesis protein [Spirochaetia bacterium]|nr:cobalamin biosynthesis protein [Spirochaetia bacterium]
MKTAVIAITQAGLKVAAKLAVHLDVDLYIPDKAEMNIADVMIHERYTGSTKELTKNIWKNYDAFIFIMSLGIVNRIISGLIKDKLSDPAVVVIDEMGRYVISALSGHEGGANKLAEKAALICRGDFVVTTGSEANKTLIAGMGCKRGTSAQTLEESLLSALKKINRSVDELRLIASVEDKEDEEGFYRLSEKLNVPLKFIGKELISQVEENFQGSTFVKKTLGVSAVAEPCAILGGFRCKIILPKTTHKETTTAIAEESFI